MSCKLTEIMSYRKIWAWKSLWRSSCLIPHSKHIQIQQVVQDCVWMSFEYLQWWWCQYPYQYFVVLIVKRCFLKSDWNSWFCSLCLLPLIQFLYTSEKSLPSPCHTIMYLCSTMRLLQPLSSSGWTNTTPSPVPHISMFFWISAFSDD